MRGCWTGVFLVIVLSAVARGGDDGSASHDSPQDPLARAVLQLTGGSIDDVLRGLASDEALERRAAAIVAGRRSGRSAALIDELIAATGDDDDAVRLAATRAIGACGPRAGHAVTRLARLAEHATNVAQRHAAAASLVRLAPLHDDARRLLRDPAGRDLVFAGLVDLGAEGVATLVSLSRASAWRTRAAATRALARADATAAGVRRAFDVLLRDDSPAVRVAALETLPDIFGSGLLTRADVERSFSESASTRERVLLLVALAEPGLPAGVTDPAVREAALVAAAAAGGRDERRVAVRMADRASLRSDVALICLARIAGGDDLVAGREAAAALWRAAREAPLSDPVAAAMQVMGLYYHDDARVAATVAAGLTVGGREDPVLAAPMCRLLVSRSWGGWTSSPMRTVPLRLGRRNLRRGRNLRAGGRASRPSLAALAGLTHDDLLEALRSYPRAATSALRELLSSDLIATRANAVWMLAEVRQDDETSGQMLRPLLDDVALSVRIVAALRCARTDAQAPRAARALVGILLGDGVERYRDTTFLWDDEMLAALTTDAHAAVGALVDVWQGYVELRRANDLSELDTPPGRRRASDVVTALGDEAFELLVDALIESQRDRDRLVAIEEIFGTVQAIPAAARRRLETLRDDSRIGLTVRRILGE